MRVWLIQLLVWFARILPAKEAAPAALHWLVTAAERQVDANLRKATRCLRAILVLHAYADRPVLPALAFKRTRRPSSVLRRAQRTGGLRKHTATALRRFQRGSLKERAERLRDALDNMAPLIAEVRAHTARIRATPRPAGVLIAITDDACPANAPVHAPICADTS